MKFGTDGVRGAANTELTAEFALRLGRAAAQVLAPDAAAPAVVIGGDTRESTPMFRAALGAGFASEGIEVIDVATATTPLVAFEAQRLGVMGAVISASHNPYRDNGIKLFAAGGTKLSDDVEQRIEQALTDLGPPAATPGRIGLRTDSDAYVDHVLTMLEGRSLGGLRIVLDAANGAGSDIAPAALARTGADLVVVANNPDGRNINDGCGAMHPEFVAAAVREHGADIGLALDGDADRLIAVDHTGAVVDGDHLIAICARDLRARGELAEDTVVVTVMTNLGFRLAMARDGIDVVETAVGDRYVLEALARRQLSLGGEQSGHVIFADHATTGDGLLTALVILDVMARSGRRLAELAAEAMTALPQVLLNVSVAQRVPDAADRLAAEIEAEERALGETGRILVRASGTEPLVRVMVEAPTHDIAQHTAERLADVARRRFN